MQNLTYITTKKLIVHEFPKKDDKTRTGVFADLESALTANVSRFFEERIRTALTGHGLDVSFDPASASPVPNLVLNQLVGKKPHFAKDSRTVAAHLFGLPHSARSDGLFCMLRFEANGHSQIAIVKLDYEEGTRAQRTGKAGKQQYVIQHIVDLMLTNKTELFKVALFEMPAGKAAIADIEGRMCDYQAGRATVADYFVRDFLGCTIKGQPNIFTRDFLDGAEHFFKENITDPEQRTRYQLAVMAELNNNFNRVRPSTFADGNIDPAHRAGFLKELEDRGVPLNTFRKDTELIRSRISRILFRFDKNVDVLSPADEVNESVKLSKGEEGEDDTIEVTGRLVATKGAH